MIDLPQISRHTLQTEPFAWAEIGNLYSPRNAAALAASFPCDHFKTVMSYGGEKDYEYEARALIAMGADTISQAETLSEAWLSLARGLLSPAYRIAMSLLTGRDLTAAPLEVNVFHYGPGACLGPHPDLTDKLVTHVLYFNQSWNRADGGCLNILRSADAADMAAEVLPIVGNSVVLVRSENSWHAVSRVVDGCHRSRRSLTATFYQHGSVSSMWPPGDTTPLHNYQAADLARETRRASIWWKR
jgi:SM-20-related protein